MKYETEVKEAIKNDYSFEELAKDLYQREDNYNGADVTSNQVCMTETEILFELKETYKFFKKQNNQN